MNRPLLFLSSLTLLCMSPGPSARAQELAGPPVSPQELPKGWVPLDGVAIVVNSDTITRRAIERHIERAMAENKITTREELDALAQEAQRTQVETLLIRQAGEDLGFPKELIDAHVNTMLEEQTDDAGGTFEMAQKLRLDDTTAVTIREDLEQETLMLEWRRKIAGFGGPGARSSEDRYSRPGTLAQHYRRMQRTGRDIDTLSRLGARPATYELQVLLLHAKALGSVEESQRVAVQAKAALEAGEAEWDELITNIGNYENGGLTGPRRIEEIQYALDPGDNRLIQFVMEGQLDTESAVMPFPAINPATGERRVGGFAIYRLIARQEAELPDYQLPGVQKELRRMLGILGDELRVKLALEDLERTAYIWYPGIEKREAELEKRVDEQKKAIEEARRKKAEELEDAGLTPLGPKAAEERKEAEAGGSPKTEADTAPDSAPDPAKPDEDPPLETPDSPARS